MRNSTSEQAPLGWFDLKWPTWQKGQCRAGGPYFRSQEAPDPADLTETSLCAEASLTLQAPACTSQKAFGHWFSVTPISLVLSTLPQHTSGSRETTAFNQRCRLSQSSAFSEAQFSSPHYLFAWLLSQARRGQVVCAAHSSDFKLQGCRNSWPYSWIHLFATERQRRKFKHDIQCVNNLCSIL